MALATVASTIVFCAGRKAPQFYDGAEDLIATQQFRGTRFQLVGTVETAPNADLGTEYRGSEFRRNIVLRYQVPEGCGVFQSGNIERYGAYLRFGRAESSAVFPFPKIFRDTRFAFELRSGAPHRSCLRIDHQTGWKGEAERPQRLQRTNTFGDSATHRRQ